MEAINRGMTVGAAWMILLRLCVRGIGLISTVILARLLMPSDFGLVAMAMTIITTIGLMSGFSLDVVLIQNQFAQREHYDTAWTFNLIVALLQALALFFIAPLSNYIYSDPRLPDVIRFLALNVFVEGFENIGMIAFRKDLEFHKEFLFQVIKKLMAFSVTIGLAIYLKNYWALIFGTLTSTVTAVIFSYVIQPFRPRLSLIAKSDFFHFSKWLFINNLLMFFNWQSVNFLVGKFSGSYGLGIYTISSEISNLPTSDLVAPINRAIFPGYAKMAQELGMLRQGFINVISAIALFAIPVCIGIALLADPLVHVMLGEKWLNAIPLVQILSISGLTAALQTNKSSIYLAMGRPRILTFVYTIQLVVSIPLIIFGTMYYKELGAALAILTASLFLMPINYFILFSVLKLNPFKFLETLWRPAVASSIMTMTTLIALNFFPDNGNFLSNLLKLSVSSTVGCATYTISIVILWVMSGRPETIESVILRKAPSRIRTVLKL
jgi:O-antigen/teichoic acid export membrane protein